MGQARLGVSDVDFLTVGLPEDRAAQLGSELSNQFAGLSRSVEIGAAQGEDLSGNSDAAYGMRIFLKHYCVHLAGPDPSAGLPAYPADARAARGFNGDIAHHLAGWRETVDRAEPAQLGRRVARKTLLAVAGLVSVVTSTWTTDRELAAEVYAGLHRERASEISRLWAWADGRAIADRDAVLRVLLDDGVVAHVVEEFAAEIGLWADTDS